MKTTALLATLALPFVLAACGGGTADLHGPDAGQQVTVAFAVGSAANAGSTASTASAAEASDTLVLIGPNGTLELTTVAFIVAELELDCDDDGSMPCAAFEAPPAFVDLPLGSGSVDVTSRVIPAGRYDELEFEVEALDVDDDDGDDGWEQTHAAALLAEIRQTFPAFPEDASMVVEGVFTPSGGEPRPFLVYVDAEVEVELDLDPPLTIEADGSGSRTLVVDVHPALWFVRGDGVVRDLSVYDGGMLELEVEIEDGFVEVEFD